MRYCLLQNMFVLVVFESFGTVAYSHISLCLAAPSHRSSASRSGRRAQAPRQPCAPTCQNCPSSKTASSPGNSRPMSRLPHARAAVELQRTPSESLCLKSLSLLVASPHAYYLLVRYISLQASGIRALLCKKTCNFRSSL